MWLKQVNKYVVFKLPMAVNIAVALFIIVARYGPHEMKALDAGPQGPSLLFQSYPAQRTCDHQRKRRESSKVQHVFSLSLSVLNLPTSRTDDLHFFQILHEIWTWPQMPHSGIAPPALLLSSSSTLTLLCLLELLKPRCVRAIVLARSIVDEPGEECQDDQADYDD